MAEQQRVLMYGDSVLLAGVQASLSAFPDLEIISLEELPADWAVILHELHPSVIIFDLGSVPPDLPLAILRQPHLRLIGIGPDSEGTLVLSSHPAQALSAQDLLNMIRDCAQSPTEGK